MIDIEILNKLNAPTREERLENLREVLKTAEFPPMVPQYINNHIHTTYSFSPYSPTAAVFAARMEGLCTAGIIDHDSISGAREFLEAAKMVEMPVTVGMECRASMNGTRLEGRRTNNPDQVGVSYMTIQSVPHDRIEELNAFFAPYREARGRRNRAMIERINALLPGIELDYDRDVLPLSESKEGGGVTERHLMFALAKAMVNKAGRGQSMVDYLASIGLSLSAPAYTPNAIMTYKDQKSRERQMRITFLSIGLTTVVLMLLLAFCGKLYMGYLDEKAHKAELESRIASWPVLYTPDQLRNNLADTQKWQVQARTLAKRRIAAALMTELSTITPEAIHITGMRVTFKDVNPGKQEARRGTKKPSEPEESAVAVLTGSVAGDMLQRESQLAEFLSQLEHSPMVLSLVVEKQQTDTEILSFVATLRLV